MSDTDTDNHEGRPIKLLNSLVNNLKKDSVMLELLHWEITGDNETTRASAQKREFCTLGLTKEYEFLFRNTGVDVVSIATLIISGIYYLSRHRDHSQFCEIDMREKWSGAKNVSKAPSPHK